MSRTFKNLLITLLVCASVFPLTACAASENNAAETTAAAADTEVSETTAEGESGEARLYPDLPDTDWGGAAFNVMGRTHDTYWFFRSFEIFAESENGETVNDAVFRRNREIEEKYNVKITQDLVIEPQTELPKLVAAGDSTHDMSFQNQLNVHTVAATGALMDLYSLDYIDFDQPWWSSELNRRISVHNRLYFTTSDFGLVDKQRTSILFFNRDMAEDFALDNFFDLVRDGSWTIDKMTEFSEAVSSDLDGDGDMDQHDRYGTGYERYNTAVMAFAADNVVCGKDEDDLPVLMMNTPHMISTIDKILGLCGNTDIMFYEQDYSGKYDGDYWSMSETTFKDGRLLFCGSFVESFKEMSAECTDEYGVIPFPKYDEEQENYYTISAQGLLITVPVTAKDPDFSGFMLEALSAYSKYTTLPAYIEVSCKTKYMYDADSAEMLDLTFDGLVFDLGQLYRWGGLFDILEANIPQSRTNNFASLYAAAEEKALAEIDNTVEVYMGLE